MMDTLDAIRWAEDNLRREHAKEHAIRESEKGQARVNEVNRLIRSAAYPADLTTLPEEELIRRNAALIGYRRAIEDAAYDEMQRVIKEGGAS